MSSEGSSHAHETVIDDILLAIARRADELARMRLFQTGLNAACWFRAEEEVLGGAGRNLDVAALA